MNRTPNFETRIEAAGPYVVRFLRSGTCEMSGGLNGDRTTEPAMWATIWRDGRVLSRPIPLNSTQFCQNGYSVRGPEATAAEIVRATLCDEHIFTGEPSFPEEWATAAEL